MRSHKNPTDCVAAKHGSELPVELQQSVRGIAQIPA
jgi:hypothetical protein